MAKLSPPPAVLPELKKDGIQRATPVTAGKLSEVKTSGVKMRGTGAATKGMMARGSMA